MRYRPSARRSQRRSSISFTNTGNAYREPAAAGWFEYDPLVPQVTLACVLRTHLRFQPGLLVRGWRRDFIPWNDFEPSYFSGPSNDVYPLVVGVVFSDELVQVGDGKTRRLLHKNDKGCPVLIPLPQLLADDVEHALRVPTVLRYLNSDHSDGAGLPVDNEHFRVRSVSSYGPHVVVLIPI